MANTFLPRKGDDGKVKWDYSENGKEVKAVGIWQVLCSDGELVHCDTFSFLKTLAEMEDAASLKISDAGISFELDGKQQFLTDFFAKYEDGKLLIISNYPNPVMIEASDEDALKLIQANRPDFESQIPNPPESFEYIDSDMEIDQKAMEWAMKLEEATAENISSGNVMTEIPDLSEYTVLGNHHKMSLREELNADNPEVLGTYDEKTAIILKNSEGKYETCVISVGDMEEYASKHIYEQVKKLDKSIDVVVIGLESDADASSAGNLPDINYDDAFKVTSMKLSRLSDRTKVFGTVSALGDEHQEYLGIPVAMNKEEKTVTFMNGGTERTFKIDGCENELKQIQKSIEHSGFIQGSFYKIPVVENNELCYKEVFQENGKKAVSIDEIRYMDESSRFVVISTDSKLRVVYTSDMSDLDQYNVEAVPSYDDKEGFSISGTRADIQLVDLDRGIILAKNPDNKGVDNTYSVSLSQEERDAFSKNLKSAGFKLIDGKYINPSTEIDKNAELIIDESIKKERTLSSAPALHNVVIESDNKGVVLSCDEMESGINLKKLSVEKTGNSQILIAESQNGVRYNISSFGTTDSSIALQTKDINKLVKEAGTNIHMQTLYMFKDNSELFTRIRDEYVCISNSAVPPLTMESKPDRSIQVENNIYDAMVEKASEGWLNVYERRDGALVVNALDVSHMEDERMERIVTIPASQIAEIEDKEQDVHEPVNNNTGPDIND